jgi:competence protein ComEA
VIAARIVAYREQHGAFRSAEDLKNIPGIGEKTLEKIRDEVIVG